MPLFLNCNHNFGVLCNSFSCPGAGTERARILSLLGPKLVPVNLYGILHGHDGDKRCRTWLVNQENVSMSSSHINTCLVNLEGLHPIC